MTSPRSYRNSGIFEWSPDKASRNIKGMICVLEEQNVMQVESLLSHPDARGSFGSNHCLSVVPFAPVIYSH